MTTVLCIPGAMSGSQLNPAGSLVTLQAALGGPQALLQQLGDNSTAEIIPVSYNDWDASINGAISGAIALDAALKAAPLSEKIVVYGHSYGAVAACIWQRLYGFVTTIDPTRVTFVLIGNSIRPNNGLAISLYGPAGPNTGIWRTIDIAREFDKWADYPNVAASPDYWQAVNNCNYGDMLPDAIHISYQNIRLDQPHADRGFGGAARFLLFETNPIPSPSGLTRAQIATAYQRIVTPTW